MEIQGATIIFAVNLKRIIKLLDDLSPGRQLIIIFVTAIEDIVYAEVFDRKVIIHTMDSDIEYYGKMKETRQWRKLQKQTARWKRQTIRTQKLTLMRSSADSLKISANQRQVDSVDILEKGRNTLQEKVSAMNGLGQTRAGLTWRVLRAF